MILEALAKEHEKWCSMVRSMGCSETLIEDVVHDMYLKIEGMANPSKIMYDEHNVNHFYVFKTLYSVYVQTVKDRQHIFPKDDLVLIDEPIDMDKEEAWDAVYDIALNKINSFGPYGSKLCMVYFKTDKSMRDIASESGISLTSIFNSIRKYRAMIKEDVTEDWQDYKNGDYGKIG